MATQSLAETDAGSAVQKKRRRFHIPERFQAILILLPSLIALAIFVYVFIGMSFWISISNWRTLKMDLSIRSPIYQTYVEMFSMPRFQADLRNTLVFTLLFMTLAVLVGLFLAILLDHEVFGRTVVSQCLPLPLCAFICRDRGGMALDFQSRNRHQSLVRYPGHQCGFRTGGDGTPSAGMDYRPGYMVQYQRGISSLCGRLPPICVCNSVFPWL